MERVKLFKKVQSINQVQGGFFKMQLICGAT